MRAEGRSIMEWFDTTSFVLGLFCGWGLWQAVRILK